MPELNFEDHSEEIQEILGQIPNWIIRWGVTVLFLIFVTIILGSSFIPYPEKITVPIKIISQNAPAVLMTKSEGTRISQWFKNDGEMVQKSDILAVWETDEDYSDILTLQDLLASNKKVSSSSLSDLTLPALQSEIREYNKSLNHLTSIQNSQEHTLDIKKIEIDIDKKIIALRLSKEQQLINEREFELFNNQFKQDSIYYHDGNYGISKSEYEAEVLKFLRRKSMFLDYQASLLDLDQSLVNSRNEILKIKRERKKQLSTAKSNIGEAFFALQQRVDKWKRNNLLIAPIDGKLDRSSFWSENQFIPSGETLAAVVPEDTQKIICRAIVDTHVIGSINKGQRGLLKLDGFSSMQTGFIEGQIESISNIPLDGKYSVKINLPHGLRTLENQQLPLIQEMSGTAEIIISEETLWDKLVRMGF